MICGILDLLNFPREVLSYARTLYHILLTLHFEADVLHSQLDKEKHLHNELIESTDSVDGDKEEELQPQQQQVSTYSVSYAITGQCHHNFELLGS